MHLVAVELVKNLLLSAPSHSKRRTHRFGLQPQPFVSSIGGYHNTRASSMPVRTARRHRYCEFIRRRPTRITLAPVLLAFAEWQFHGRYPELLRLLVKSCCRMFCCHDALGSMVSVYGVGIIVRDDIKIVWVLCNCCATEVVRFSGPTSILTIVITRRCGVDSKASGLGYVVAPHCNHCRHIHPS